MATRDHIVLYINGRRRTVHGRDCFTTLSDFLRNRLRLVGTKIVCSEGDCGSCTVLVGLPDGEKLRYCPIDSCIRFMFQLDGTHIVTIEGLANDGQLTPIQQSMVDCHGSQCGFCTPGFVMSMTGALEEHGSVLSEDEWRHALTGNLCRCTGYTTILAAGQQAAQKQIESLNEVYAPTTILNDIKPLRGDTLDLREDTGDNRRQAFCPVSLADAIAFRKQSPHAKIVAGATDVGVQYNKLSIAPEAFLDLNRIAALEGTFVERDAARRTLIAGARATWIEVLRVCHRDLPELAKLVAVFGSPQIRHVGTLGGNIINASPVADSLPFLFVMEAELELVGASGARRVNINNFYQGYKKLDLRPDELLANIRVELPQADDVLRLFKISRRRDLDISTFTAAVRMRLVGETIASAALAYGAVGPRVIRLRATEQYLRGRLFNVDTMRQAGDMAVSEITPISDVRGGAEYRYRLARNVLLKFYYEQQRATVGT